ncbi:Toxoplasma gondii family A protein [Besnoitia besnoiti]|uniref:Toxoplasma gondii family A protein n=1 Tax=Besnoitia besnoiti TaxID=94643 RepID=A0A2A9MFH8_BESBE|nr:Toxoplasma gondii family A protein [Besnoitia besnoiti]PFH36745.1 Toxoplasma gondii family A protein [Besnoitia besnoiti]
MGQRMLQRMWFIFLVGGALSGAESVAGKTTTRATPDYTVSIPKEGLKADVERVFWLAPSKVLRVDDFSTSNVFMPQAGGATSPTPSEDAINDVAYPFHSGACDFTKTISYTQIFPKYTGKLWTILRDAGATSGQGTSYVFTNPPAGKLRGLAGFCVRIIGPRSVLEQVNTSSVAPELQSGASGTVHDSQDSKAASLVTVAEFPSTEQEGVRHREEPRNPKGPVVAEEHTVSTAAAIAPAKSSVEPASTEAAQEEAPQDAQDRAAGGVVSNAQASEPGVSQDEDSKELRGPAGLGPAAPLEQPDRNLELPAASPGAAPQLDAGLRASSEAGKATAVSLTPTKFTVSSGEHDAHSAADRDGQSDRQGTVSEADEAPREPAAAGRLSRRRTRKDVYMTIVVVSAARVLSTGAAAVGASLVAIAAVLTPAC